MPWRRRKIVLGTLIFVGVAAGLLLSVFGSRYQGFRIPSNSMHPNMLVGDHFYARRLGPVDPVGRGDLVVFEFPNDRRLDRVCRCVAIAGDAVEIRDGITYVNGAAYESALDDPAADHSCVPRGSPCSCPEPHTYLAPGGLQHGAFNREFGPIVVPEDHVFVMGDNRYNSLDSRYFGPVPRDHVKARPDFIYWSVDANRGLRVGRLLKRLR